MGGFRHYMEHSVMAVWWDTLIQELCHRVRDIGMEPHIHENKGVLRPFEHPLSIHKLLHGSLIPKQPFSILIRYGDACAIHGLYPPFNGLDDPGSIASFREGEEIDDESIQLAIFKGVIIDTRYIADMRRCEDSFQGDYHLLGVQDQFHCL